MLITAHVTNLIPYISRYQSHISIQMSIVESDRRTTAAPDVDNDKYRGTVWQVNTDSFIGKPYSEQTVSSVWSGIVSITLGFEDDIANFYTLTSHRRRTLSDPRNFWMSTRSLNRNAFIDILQATTPVL